MSVIQRQTHDQIPSLIIQPLLSNSAKFSCAMKGKPSSPPCICPPKQSSLHCLWSFSDHLFHLPVSVSLCEFCARYCFKCSMNWWLEFSWSSQTTWVCWWSTIAFNAQRTKSNPSYSINIGRLHSKQEIVPAQFQQFNIISAGIITMSNYNRKAWYNLRCPLKAYCHLSTTAKLSIS